jgi:hypothetical protein
MVFPAVLYRRVRSVDSPLHIVILSGLRDKTLKTFTVIVALGCQPATDWPHKNLTPAFVAEGTGAIDEPIPSEAEVYHIKSPVAVAVTAVV